MLKLEQKREFNSEKLNWVLVGDHGSIHMWCDSKLSCGGMEMHSRKPLSYSKSEPDHKECWTHGGDCWHDGSSLYWYETGRRIVGDAIATGNEQLIWHELESWYRSKFAEQLVEQAERN